MKCGSWQRFIPLKPITDGSLLSLWKRSIARGAPPAQYVPLRYGNSILQRALRDNFYPDGPATATWMRRRKTDGFVTAVSGGWYVALHIINKLLRHRYRYCDQVYGNVAQRWIIYHINFFNYDEFKFIRSKTMNWIIWQLFRRIQVMHFCWVHVTKRVSAILADLLAFAPLQVPVKFHHALRYIISSTHIEHFTNIYKCLPICLIYYGK